MAVHGDRPPGAGGGGGGLGRAAVKAEIKPYARTDNPSDLVSRPDLDPDQRLPVPEAGKFLKWNAGADALENTDEPAGGGSGLDQDQVDTRIDALIPPGRRVPSYAAGDAGQALAVNGDGTALHFAPVQAGSSYRGEWAAGTTYAKGEIVSSDAKFYISLVAGNTGNAVSSATHWSEISAEEITEQAVYNDAKNIVVGGHGITAASDDATRRIILSADGVPSGLALPASPHIGDRFRLLADETLARDRAIHYNEAASVATETRWDFSDAPTNGPQYIIGYSLGHTTPALRNTAYLVTGGSYAMPADLEVVFYETGESRRTYAVADTARPGYPHWYLIDGLTYDQVDNSGRAHFVNFETGGSAYYPAQTISAGDYTFAGGSHGTDGWVKTPGALYVAPLASWRIDGARSAVRSVTAPATAGDWSAWTTLATTPAATADQRGEAILVGHVHAVSASADSGGDRIITECRVRRTRGAATETLLDESDYGPRNAGGASSAPASATPAECPTSGSSGSARSRKGTSTPSTCG